jgi:hypothetical protein
MRSHPGYDDGEDHGPGDSDDGPDHDEYEPGGAYFDQEDTPSLEDHPMYNHFHLGAANY